MRQGEGKGNKQKGRQEEGGKHQAKPQPNKHISIKALDGATGNSSKCNNSNNNNNDCHQMANVAFPPEEAELNLANASGNFVLNGTQSKAAKSRKPKENAC
ncbi:hypothetical protein ACLKA6_005850 [Drosophila palustris]